MFSIGIDGGGSTVRVVVLDEDRQVCGEAVGSSVNPNSVGRDGAARALQAAIEAALAAANADRAAVGRVGAGVAGALTPPFHDWLRDMLRAVLPNAAVAITSDVEIALIGAHGVRRGVLVLSGTGSAAFGVNAAGESALAGGWGYLFGDEGSGAWIGTRALAAVARHTDGRGAPTMLTERIFNLLHVSDARQLIEIIYQPNVPAPPRLARFAPLVLELAETDPTASAILVEAIDELRMVMRAVIDRLNLDSPPIAFGGGLLSAPNALSLGLQRALNLPAFPTRLHSAEMGAALYALEMLP